MKQGWAVGQVASWDGWCSPCAREDRPLVLTRSGVAGVRAWLAGIGDDDRCLLLTCRVCGQWQNVPLREQDDPEVVLEDETYAAVAEVLAAATAVPVPPVLPVVPLPRAVPVAAATDLPAGPPAEAPPVEAPPVEAPPAEAPPVQVRCRAAVLAGLGPRAVVATSAREPRPLHDEALRGVADPMAAASPVSPHARAAAETVLSAALQATSQPAPRRGATEPSGARSAMAPTSIVLPAGTALDVAALSR